MNARPISAAELLRLPDVLRSGGVAVISSRTREKAYATQREVSHRLAHVPHLRATVEPPRQPGEPFRTRVRASD